MSYNDLINIDELNKKKEEFIDERWEVSFYCRDCKKIVQTKRVNPNWYRFLCELCWENNISIWTYEWLKSSYKIR